MFCTLKQLHAELQIYLVIYLVQPHWSVSPTREAKA